MCNLYDTRGKKINDKHWIANSDGFDLTIAWFTQQLQQKHS